MENWKCPKCGREFKRFEQSHYCEKPKTIDEYIAAQEESLQPKLRELRGILRAALPEAEERISWSMPTWWKGQNLIHFAAAKNTSASIRAARPPRSLPKCWKASA